MVIYSRKSIPYILRILKIIFHPGIIVVMIAILAVDRNTSFFTPPNDFMIEGIVIITSIWLFFCAAKIWAGRIHERIIHLEIVPTGLRMKHLRYDQEEDIVIQTNDLDIELIKETGEEDRKPDYHLVIRDQSKRISFKLMDKKKAIYEILASIQTSEVIELRPNEVAFVNENRN